MRNAFISELIQIAEDRRVIAMLADNGIMVFDEYRRQRPNQFFNLGIAESNLIGMAAGLASCGYIPFVYTIVPFLVMRPYEYIRNDLCYQDMNVKLAGIGAGFAYSTLGPTHHGTEDISILRCLPNMVIISPADPIETRKATKAAYEHKGPVYLRIGTGKNPIIYESDYEFVIGRGIVLKDGKDVGIIATGAILSEVLKAAEILEAKNISSRVVNMHTLKPIDEKSILETADRCRVLLTVEEHNIIGGLGSAVVETLMEKNHNKILLKRMGLCDCFCKVYGPIDDVRKKVGLFRTDIAREAENLLAKLK